MPVWLFLARNCQTGSYFSVIMGITTTKSFSYIFLKAKLRVTYCTCILVLTTWLVGKSSAVGFTLRAGGNKAVAWCSYDHAAGLRRITAGRRWEQHWSCNSFTSYIVNTLKLVFTNWRIILWSLFCFIRKLFHKIDEIWTN